MDGKGQWMIYETFGPATIGGGEKCQVLSWILAKEDGHFSERLQRYMHELEIHLDLDHSEVSRELVQHAHSLPKFAEIEGGKNIMNIEPHDLSLRFHRILESCGVIVIHQIEGLKTVVTEFS